MRSTAEAGRPGGRLAIAERSEPKTFNPVTALDQSSRDVFRRMMADLIHINRATQKCEPALASSWTASPDGRRFTLRLRHGLRFSDGAPFDADDVLFSFTVYLDERVHSPQRDLLLIGDQPLAVEKLDAFTVRFTFPAPYAAAERVFDSIAILPRHLLEKKYREGKIAQVWNLDAPPENIAGLGPFRLKQFVPGERVVLERNPYYWKVDAKGQKLPYLDELVFLSIPNPEARVIRFQAGDTQVINGLSAENFNALAPDQQARHFRLYDAGPGLEYNFLFFNLNDDVAGRLPRLAAKQRWFQDARFRQAVSSAVDRAAMVRLVYQGKGAALATHVTPGNKLWIDRSIPVPQVSLPRSRRLLREAGFSWKADGALTDPNGEPVEFSILVSSSNAQRVAMTTLAQDDLKRLGMKVNVVTMESRAAHDRILQSHDYEAAMLGLESGDADPTAEMNVWISSGQTHLWHLGEKAPSTPWEAEIDRLMERQLVTRDFQRRKRLYDQVQETLAKELPVICLASPDVLAGAREGLGNFQPVGMENNALWNADELFWRAPTNPR